MASRHCAPVKAAGSCVAEARARMAAALCTLWTGRCCDAASRRWRERLFVFVGGVSLLDKYGVACGWKKPGGMQVETMPHPTRRPTAALIGSESAYKRSATPSRVLCSFAAGRPACDEERVWQPRGRAQRATCYTGAAHRGKAGCGGDRGVCGLSMKISNGATSKGRFE